jgi:hypothetical protein
VSPRFRGHRRLVLAWFLVAATSSGVYAQAPSTSPDDSTRNQAPAAVQTAPVPARAGTGPIFIPGPDKPKAGESSPDSETVGNLVERLFSHPQMREQIQGTRPLVRQKMERAPQDGQGTQPAPGSTSTPTQGTVR